MWGKFMSGRRRNGKGKNAVELSNCILSAFGIWIELLLMNADDLMIMPIDCAPSLIGLCALRSCSHFHNHLPLWNCCEKDGVKCAKPSGFQEKRGRKGDD
jgi:hypothetical protein